MEGQSSAASNLVPSEGSYNFSGLQEHMQVDRRRQNPQPYQNFMAFPHQVQDCSFNAERVIERDQSVSFLNCDNKVERGKSSACDNDVSIVVEEGEEAHSDCDGGGRRKSAILPKKGKWRSISEVMAERGYRVSPQQCEDKFNDLNKRYKKLNDLLGKGTSCKVVENPVLLDLMDLSEKVKDDIRKILSSKQLFYEEMCSYHNGNKLYLPHDQSLQRSMQLALTSNDSLHPHTSNDLYEEDQDISSYNQNGEGGKAERFQNQRMVSRSLQLEEQKFQIQARFIDLEQKRLKWVRIKQQEDRELEKMRQENEYLKLENEHLALQLQHHDIRACIY
ncbi:hypothetical protein NMG60_11021494 [Bertholletia excelsa]